MPFYEGSLVYSDTGCASLLPYLMPRSVDEHGEEQEQGRYAIAYSRDGWFVLDTEAWTILRWAASEKEAVQDREALFREPCRGCGASVIPPCRCTDDCNCPDYCPDCARLNKSQST